MKDKINKFMDATFEYVIFGSILFLVTYIIIIVVSGIMQIAGGK